MDSGTFECGNDQAWMAGGLTVSLAILAPRRARVHAMDLRPGMTVVLDGAAREVVGRARAIDGTLDLALRGGGVANLHPYRRVSIVVRGGR